MGDAALPLFEQNNRNILFETLRQLSYDEILRICQVNKDVNNFSQDNLQIQSLLISKRTDKLIEQHGGEHNTLIYASRNDDLPVLNELLARGVDPNKHMTIKFSDPVTVLQCFWRAQPHPDYKDDHPLIEAVRHNRLNIVDRLLIDPKIDPSIFHNLAIIEASQHGYLDLVNRLLEDRRVDPSDLNNVAIIMTTANIDQGSSYCRVISRLLDDPRVNEPSVDPFNNDIFRENLTCVDDVDLMKKLLADPRFDPSENDNDAIRMATSYSSMEVIELLLADPRVDPSTDNDWGVETLMHAAQREDKILMRRLLNIPSVYNSTPYLHDYLDYVNGISDMLPQHCWYYC